MGRWFSEPAVRVNGGRGKGELSVFSRQPRLRRISATLRGQEERDEWREGRRRVCCIGGALGNSEKSVEYAEEEMKGYSAGWVVGWGGSLARHWAALVA